jgi:hypothetical protein
MTRLKLMISTSVKFVFLDRILPIFKQSGRSVLIFSQRLKVLKTLAEYCKLKKYSHELLIGDPQCAQEVGRRLLKNPEREAHAITGLLSKTARDVITFSQWLVTTLSHCRVDQQNPIVVPDLVSLSQRAPAPLRDAISIPTNEATIVLQQILLNGVTRRALATIRSKNPEMMKTVHGGHDWWTVSHCVTLFEKLVQFGMDSLAAILLSPDLRFREHLTESDMEYLKTFNKLHLKPETSRLPLFLMNENRFYGWMKMIVGNPARQPGAKLPQPMRPPQMQIPAPPRPAIPTHQAILRPPPRLIPVPSTPAPPIEKPKQTVPMTFQRLDSIPAIYHVKPETLGPPQQIPPRPSSPVTVRKHVLRKVPLPPNQLSKSLMFVVPETRSILFHCGDPAAVRKELNRKVKA